MGVMQTFMVYGKGETLDQKYLDEAFAAIEAKVGDSISSSQILTKNGGQGSDGLGLVTCEYEWDLDQKEKFK